MCNLLLYILVSFINVFLHIYRSIAVIKSSKLKASTLNAITYTFSAIVVKFISESSLVVAMLVALGTNFLGCWVGMWCFERLHKQES